MKNDASTQQATRDRVVIQHDTISMVQQVPVEVVREKPLTHWQKVQMRAGKAFLALMAVFGVLIIITMFLKAKK